MPSYYNPYNFYPATYQSPVGYSTINQPVLQQPIQQQSFASGPKVMEWVEGEVGAKAYQMPAGWPVNQPIPLWDSTDTIIYLKSWSQMGFPNPLQKIHYTMENQTDVQTLPAGQSGDAKPASSDNVSSQYVTKEDLNEMRNEIRGMISGMMNQNSSVTQNNQNGSNNQGNQSGNENRNRGGNR